MFLLVRHAMCDPVGTSIAGRAPGVSLNDVGRVQARSLAAALAGVALDAVYASPLERAWETACAVAAPHGLDVQRSPSLTEVDFGRWTGCAFTALDEDAAWRRFNAFRSGTRAPGGEHLLEVQARSVAEVARLIERHGAATVVLVSHGDVIRALIAHYAGIPLDLFHRLEITPASVSAIEVTADGARIVQLNGSAAPAGGE